MPIRSVSRLADAISHRPVSAGQLASAGVWCGQRRPAVASRVGEACRRECPGGPRRGKRGRPGGRGQPAARDLPSPRTARAATMTMAPDQMLLQYMAAVTGTVASRMNGEMISQTPAEQAGRLQAFQAAGAGDREQAQAGDGQADDQVVGGGVAAARDLQGQEPRRDGDPQAGQHARHRGELGQRAHRAPERGAPGCGAWRHRLGCGAVSGNRLRAAASVMQRVGLQCCPPCHSSPIGPARGPALRGFRGTHLRGAAVSGQERAGL